MNKIVRIGFLSLLTLVFLVACGKDEPVDESASLGELLGVPMGESSPGCPEYSDPVCAGSGLTYTNACHAKEANETEWQPGKC